MTTPSPSEIRARLDSLRTAVLDLSPLGENNTVPAKFLTDHNIRYDFHQFATYDTAKDCLEKKPPILFLPRPAGFLKQFPNEYSKRIEGRPEGPSEPKYPTWDAPRDLPDIRATHWSPWNRGRELADYLIDWAFGDYRRVPHGKEDLADQCNLKQINVRHGLDQGARGFICEGGDLGNCWEGLTWEYKPDNQTKHPHLILVLAQTSTGVNQKITQSELAVIVTAMRNRSREPLSFDEEADSDDSAAYPGRRAQVNEAELRFKRERRFPVR